MKAAIQKSPGRNLFRALALSLSAALVATGAFAQESGKTIRIINQFAPGGGADAIVRPLLERFGAEMGRNAVIEHKPGASGAIAAAELEKANPDGSTLIIDTQTLSTNSVLRKVNYKHSEWEPVTLLGQIPLTLLTRKDLPAKDLADLVTQARNNPGKITYAILGPGSAAHLAALQFEQAMGVKLLAVSYRGTSEIHTDLIGARIDVFFDGVTQALPRHKSGQLKVLGVGTPERLAQAPELPTFKEQGFDLTVGAWFGIAAPKGTPADIINRLADSFAKALNTPEYQRNMAERGVIVSTMGPKQFATFRRDDQARWAELIRKTGLVVE
jgi:tripartite-type tricarboxylate transporter receptor subunit TctC